MSKSKFVFLAVAAVLFTSTIFGQPRSPVSTVRSFYGFDRVHGQAFNRRNIEARKRWFSSELYSLFLKELRREDEYLRKNPNDKPYFGDGLPFQPYDESCSVGRRSIHKTVKVAPAFQKGDRAAVTATFAFSSPCKDPDASVYTIGLIKVKGTWTIDDVNYGEDRTLKQDLNRKDY